MARKGEAAKKDAMTIEELRADLMKVKKEDQMDGRGFICIGTAKEIYGLPNEDAEVFVWRKTNGTEVTMYDEGNGKCSLVAVVKISNAPSMVNATPLSLATAKDLVTV